MLQVFTWFGQDKTYIHEKDLFFCNDEDEYTKFTLFLSSLFLMKSMCLFFYFVRKHLYIFIGGYTTEVVRKRKKKDL